MGALGQTSMAAITACETVSGFQPLHSLEVDWFRSIPPERIGINGEYDYYGLMKRVRYQLREQTALLKSIKIRQRGRVIILKGHLSSAEALSQAIKLVMDVEGVDAVETHGVEIRTAATAISA